MRNATQSSSPRRLKRKLTAGVVAAFALLTPALVLASDVDVSVVDVTTPTNSVTVAPGGSDDITINMRVTGNQLGTATFEVYRNWTLSAGTFTGSNPQEFTVAPRSGGDPATTFSTTGTVSVASGQSLGAFTLAVGAFDITNSNDSGAKLSAGGSSTYSVTVSAPSDTTPPVITPTVVGELGNNGWYTSDVTVSWSVVDDQSSIISSSGCTTTTINADTSTSGVTLTCSATSAGGTASQSVTVKRDTTAPTITGSASPAANINGWNHTDVTASFICTDTSSGIASCGPNKTLVEGADQSVTGTAVDLAGNTNSDTVSGINIDKTKPVVTVTGVSNGATYTLGSVPDAACSTTDALSGVNTDATFGTSGGPVGAVTVTCTGAVDNAGHINSATVTYQVVYAWTGFFQPVDNPTVVGGQITNFGWNKAKAGSAIPVKFSLGGNQGLEIFAAGFPKVTQVACPTTVSADAVEETVTANSSGLKYDTVAGQYIYVWKTATTYAGKCWRLDVKLSDETIHSAYFNFTK